MSKKLFIVESPAKAKTIEKYLKQIKPDDDYKVKASVGHIRDLPKSNKDAIDIENGFIPKYEISQGKEKVVSELKQLTQKSDEIILATDLDREGEAIAWHIVQALNPKKVKRIVFNEITKDAIKEALANPRDIDENLKSAQEARRVLDRLVGYDLSGLIWKKVRYGLSAGRVQSPALRILAERERQIQAFIPETYYVIEANLQTKKGENMLFTCKDQPKDEKEADQILKKAKKEKWMVKKLQTKEAKRSPQAPFTTSTLQQKASSRLSFAPSRTMSLAQKLYEAGHITYMRTDSNSLSSDAQKQILNLIDKKFGKDLIQARNFKPKSKNAQEAHEAIRPTSLNTENAGKNEDEKKLYKLIWQRTMASQMSDAKILQTKIIANTKDEQLPDFAINGSQIISDGWLLIDPEARSEDTILPKVKEADELNLLNIEKQAKETEPPNRYSEAGLVKELEKRGVGRPSTYASIIKTIVDRGYAEKEGRSLKPTDTGMVVSEFLENNFEKYVSDDFTAQMEDRLDDIASGKAKYEKTLKDFYTPFLADLKSKENIEKITNLGDAPEEFKCPKCGEKMIIKLGKNGKFISCSKFPDCDGARTIEGEEMKGPEETGEDCPKCGESKDGKLVSRDGRFGRFISCSRYPKCKFIKEDPEEEKKKKTGVKCPKCEDGEMKERRGRFGLFYSCSNYPDCKYAIKAKPTGKTCKECGALMMEGTKTIPERCSEKLCPNHRPDKKE